MMDTLNGKHIWIIGASSGIGCALAHELSNQGAHLILSARREDMLKKLNQKLGDKHTVLPLDVADLKSLSTTIKKIKILDSVIFLAAIYAPHDKQPKDIDFIHKMMNINLGGVFNTVHTVLPFLQKQGFGQIVLCGSVAGYRGLPYGQPYCATKAAIINYAESLYTELKPENIDVKVINPGFVKTPLTDKNNFPMPMMISAETAAKAIAKGLVSKSFEIHFPKKFTFIMKFLRILPNVLYFKIGEMMRKKQ